MRDTPPSVPGAASRFFDNYLICLRKASVPEKARRWYVKRVEEFIKAQNGRKIKTLTGPDLAQYFEMIGRENRLSGWQFRQCIDAIRILFCDYLTLSACHDVDWQYWLASAAQLEAEHATTARQLTPEELSYIKERKGEGPLNDVRAAHRDLLVRFTTEIRRRGYSYRTEQSYEHWVCRFILFCEGASADAVGTHDVRSFLEYLAVRRHVSASTQNQALNALVFLFAQVLGRQLGELEAFVRARRPKKLPVMLSVREVTKLLGMMEGSTTCLHRSYTAPECA